MISYSKYILFLFFALLFSCVLNAQPKSSISRLEFCYYSENVEFKYNFKSADFDSISFVITFYTDNDSISTTIVFKKNNIEKKVLRRIGNRVNIKYSDSGKEKSRKVNLLNYPCRGRAPSKSINDK